MSTIYDAIVVGARCGGSPTAMLLARKGHRVLLVDRASFPSDTISCHFLHQSGVACLERWGLLPEVTRSNCPPVRSQILDVGPIVLRGAPAGAGGVTDAYAVRRTVLDEMLVGAAAAAGAEVRERFPVSELLVEGARVTGIRCRAVGGATVTERARIVIGADGMNSLVARSVEAPTYNAHPSLTCAYYSYWSGVDVQGAELYARPGQMIIAAPTNDGQVFVIVYWPTQSSTGSVLTSRATSSARSSSRPGLPSGSATAREASASAAPEPCRTSTVARTATDGRWSATPATTRIRSRRSA